MIHKAFAQLAIKVMWLYKECAKYRLKLTQNVEKETSLINVFNAMMGII